LTIRKIRCGEYAYYLPETYERSDDEFLELPHYQKVEDSFGVMNTASGCVVKLIVPWSYLKHGELIFDAIYGTLKKGED